MIPKPLNKHVFIEIFEPESVTPGGILLPDQAKDKARLGKVVAVNPGHWNSEVFEHPIVSVGQKIAFFPYALKELDIDGTKYHFVHEDEIVATFE